MSADRQDWARDLTPEQIPAVIARLARLEQAANNPTFGGVLVWMQPQDAAFLALAQQALREWVSVGVAIQALERARKVFPDSVAAGPEGSGYAYAWDELTGDEQEWVKDEVLALLDTLEQLKVPRTVLALKLEDPADAD